MIDVHAHFLTERSGRTDWREINRRRIEAGDRVGVTVHVASILGSWGNHSPTYFPSEEDVTHANTRLLELAAAVEGKVRGYCVVNPNYGVHARNELNACFERGMIGIKLAASRRANDRLIDPIAEFAARHHAPILHHIWQHRRTEWPGQEASDATELAELASRHLDANFILAHIGGGGDWAHSLRVVGDTPNIWVDLSGSGVDTGMLEAVIAAVGPQRVLWGADVTIDTGLAKLRYLETMGLSKPELNGIKEGNARSIFPDGAFP